MLLPNNRSLFAYLGPLHKDQINDDENSDYDENSDENKNGDTNENSDTDENSDEDKSSVHSSPFLPPKHTCKSYVCNSNRNASLVQTLDLCYDSIKVEILNSTIFCQMKITMLH